MSHVLTIDDEVGDLVEMYDVCSDSCHRTLAMRLGEVYAGWNGCHELEFGTACDNCGVWLCGFEDDICHDQMSNIVVARFRTDETIYCDDGHVLQLAERYLIS